MRSLLRVASAVSAALVLLLGQARGTEITAEANEGHSGEMQFRFGPTFQLSNHWNLDTGASLIEFQGSCIEAGDTTLLYRFIQRGKWSLVGGSGIAVFSARTWAHEDSKTLWTFSNKMGLAYSLTKDSSVGLQWRHYSDAFYRPNTSKDFVGLRYTVRL
jgi:hypothetical protein